MRARRERAAFLLSPGRRRLPPRIRRPRSRRYRRRVDSYLRECARCGVAIFVTAAERDVPAWLCPDCAGTKYATPLPPPPVAHDGGHDRREQHGGQDRQS